MVMLEGERSEATKSNDVLPYFTIIAVPEKKILPLF
jgi:hypothetical protein